MIYKDGIWKRAQRAKEVDRLKNRVAVLESIEIARKNKSKKGISIGDKIN